MSYRNNSWQSSKSNPNFRNRNYYASPWAVQNKLGNNQFSNRSGYGGASSGGSGANYSRNYLDNPFGAGPSNERQINHSRDYSWRAKNAYASSNKWNRRKYPMNFHYDNYTDDDDVNDDDDEVEFVCEKLPETPSQSKDSKTTKTSVHKSSNVSPKKSHTHRKRSHVEPSKVGADAIDEDSHSLPATSVKPSTPDSIQPTTSSSTTNKLKECNAEQVTKKLIDQLTSMDKHNLKQMINSPNIKYDTVLQMKARQRFREEMRKQLRNINTEDNPLLEAVEYIDADKIPEAVFDEIERVLDVNLFGANFMNSDSGSTENPDKTMDVDMPCDENSSKTVSNDLFLCAEKLLMENTFLLEDRITDSIIESTSCSPERNLHEKTVGLSKGDDGIQTEVKLEAVENNDVEDNDNFIEISDINNSTFDGCSFSGTTIKDLGLSTNFNLQPSTRMSDKYGEQSSFRSEENPCQSSTPKKFFDKMINEIKSENYALQMYQPAFQTTTSNQTEKMIIKPSNETEKTIIKTSNQDSSIKDKTQLQQTKEISSIGTETGLCEEQTENITIASPVSGSQHYSSLILNKSDLKSTEKPFHLAIKKSKSSKALLEEEIIRNPSKYTFKKTLKNKKSMSEVQRHVDKQSQHSEIEIMTEKMDRETLAEHETDPIPPNSDDSLSQNITKSHSDVTKETQRESGHLDELLNSNDSTQSEQSMPKKIDLITKLKNLTAIKEAMCSKKKQKLLLEKSSEIVPSKKQIKKRRKCQNKRERHLSRKDRPSKIHHSSRHRSSSSSRSSRNSSSSSSSWSSTSSSKGSRSRASSKNSTTKCSHKALAKKKQAKLKKLKLMAMQNAKNTAATKSCESPKLTEPLLFSDALSNIYDTCMEKLENLSTPPTIMPAELDSDDKVRLQTTLATLKLEGADAECQQVIENIQNLIDGGRMEKPEQPMDIAEPDDVKELTDNLQKFCETNRNSVNQNNDVQDVKIDQLKNVPELPENCDQTLNSSVLTVETKSPEKCEENLKTVSSVAPKQIIESLSEFVENSEKAVSNIETTDGNNETIKNYTSVVPMECPSNNSELSTKVTENPMSISKTDTDSIQKHNEPDIESSNPPSIIQSDKFETNRECSEIPLKATCNSTNSINDKTKDSENREHIQLPSSEKESEKSESKSMHKKKSHRSHKHSEHHHSKHNDDNSQEYPKSDHKEHSHKKNKSKDKHETASSSSSENVQNKNLTNAQDSPLKGPRLWRSPGEKKCIEPISSNTALDSMGESQQKDRHLSKSRKRKNRDKSSDKKKIHSSLKDRKISEPIPERLMDVTRIDQFINAAGQGTSQQPYAGNQLLTINTSCQRSDSSPFILPTVTSFIDSSKEIARISPFDANNSILFRMKEIDLKLMELQQKKTTIDEMILKLHKDTMEINHQTMQLQNERLLLFDRYLLATNSGQAIANSQLQQQNHLLLQMQQQAHQQFQSLDPTKNVQQSSNASTVKDSEKSADIRIKYVENKKSEKKIHEQNNNVKKTSEKCHDKRTSRETDTKMDAQKNTISPTEIKLHNPRKFVLGIVDVPENLATLINHKKAKNFVTKSGDKLKECESNKTVKPDDTQLAVVFDHNYVKSDKNKYEKDRQTKRKRIVTQETAKKMKITNDKDDGKPLKEAYVELLRHTEQCWPSEIEVKSEITSDCSDKHSPIECHPSGAIKSEELPISLRINKTELKKKNKLSDKQETIKDTTIVSSEANKTNKIIEKKSDRQIMNLSEIPIKNCKVILHRVTDDEFLNFKGFELPSTCAQKHPFLMQLQSPIAERIAVSKPIELEKDVHMEDMELANFDGSFLGHKLPIVYIQVVGDHVVAASEDGNLYKYSLKTGELKNTFSEHTKTVTWFISVQNSIYSVSLDGCLKKIGFEEFSTELNSVDLKEQLQVIDHDWDTAFIGSRNGKIFVYDTITDTPNENTLCSISKSILALKTAKEGPRKILIVCCRYGNINVRDAMTGLLLRTIKVPHKVTIYTMLLDGGLIHCGTNQNILLTYDFTNGNEIERRTVGTGTICIKLYDNSIILSGSYDGYIYAYNKTSQASVSRIQGPGKMLLYFDIVGNNIIASSKDKSLRICKIPEHIK